MIAGQRERCLSASRLCDPGGTVRLLVPRGVELLKLVGETAVAQWQHLLIMRPSASMGHMPRPVQLR